MLTNDVVHVDTTTHGVDNLTELINSLHKLGLKTLATNHHTGVTVLVGERVYVRLGVSPSNYTPNVVVTDDEKLFDKIRHLIKSHISTHVLGRVFVLMSGLDGFVLSGIGIAGIPLERGNYTAPVLHAYDHVVNDLRTAASCGRLVVISGDAGSGKSHLVRGLLSEGVEGTYVLVPPDLVARLGDPQLLKSVVDARRDAKGPLVLICEDGDMCLVPRMGDNMSAIVNVLNLGDGLLGSLLDVRLIVTTNAPKLTMDKAVLREGRLCRGVEVGRLSAELATSVLYRLISEMPEHDGLAKSKVFNTSETLAHVYAEARRHGWVPQSAR